MQTVKRRMWIVSAIVIMCMLSGCYSLESAEDIAILSCKSNLEGDMDEYYALLHPAYKEYMAGDDGWYDGDEEFKEELLEFAQEHQQQISNKCGEDFEAEYEVVDVKECDESELNDVKKELKYFGYEAEEIQDAKVVTVSIQATGSKGKGSWTSKESCVKVDGSWYLHRPGFDAL